MKQTLLEEKYPVYVAEIDKAETSRQNVDEIVSYLKDKIAANPKVRFIGVADMGSKFVVTFMEAPMKPANDAMEAWAKGLRDKT